MNAALDKLMANRTVARLRQTVEAFQRHECELLAASTAYYAALSFFPLLLVLISGIGVFLAMTSTGQDAEQRVLDAVGDYASAAIRDDVGKMLKQVQTSAALGGPLGILTLLVTSLGLFLQVDRAFRRIWESKDTDAAKGVWPAVMEVLQQRLTAFAMLLALGGLIVGIFVLGMVLSTAKSFAVELLPAAAVAWSAVQLAVTVLLNTAVFAALYRTLPRIDPPWKAAFQGGFLAAVIWEIGRVALATFLIGGHYGAYGIIGSFIAVLLWIYYAATVVFPGAEYARVVQCELLTRGGRSSPICRQQPGPAQNRVPFSGRHTFCNFPPRDLRISNIASSARKDWTMINQQTLQGNWNQIKGKLREKWGQITEDDWERVKGNTDQLVGMIQHKTGEAREGIERFFDQVSSDSASAVSRASEAVRNYAHQASEYSEQAYHQAEEAVQAGYQQAEEAFQSGYRQAEDFVKQRPVESLAVVFGAGLIIGLTLSCMMSSRD